MRVVNAGEDRKGNTQYAIRRLSIFGVEYLDVSNFTEYWWSTDSRFIKDCFTSDKEYLERILDRKRKLSFWRQLGISIGLINE